MARLRYNGLTATLAGTGLDATQTDITFTAGLTHSGGLAVPTIAGSDYIPLTILDSIGNVAEIVSLTAYTSGATTGTIARAQEGTTAVVHASGDGVVHSPTVADFTSAESPSESRIYTPATGSTVVDEFDDRSIAAAWTRVDKAGGAGRATWTEEAGVLSATTTGGDAGSELHALMRPFTGALASGDGFETCFTIFGPNLVNFVMAGLVVADGVTSGAGTQVITLNYATTDATGAWQDSSVVSMTNYLTQGTYGAAMKTPPYARAFQRLTYRGANQWRQDLSINGVDWLKSTLYTQAITPTYAGLFTSSWGTATAGMVSFEYLRRVTGVA